MAQVSYDDFKITFSFSERPSQTYIVKYTIDEYNKPKLTCDIHQSSIHQKNTFPMVSIRWSMDNSNKIWSFFQNNPSEILNWYFNDKNRSTGSFLK